MDSKLREILNKVIKIREFEQRIQELYHLDIIQSPVHLSIGQELTSVLISENMEKTDKVVGNYRSHAIAVALSDNVEDLILELMAKESGVSGGKAGSMHLSVPERGLMWTSAIVGTGVPVACGIAEALRRDDSGAICTVMFGDGAIEEGGVLEAINLAQTRKLPIVFVLEDNGLAIHTNKESRTSVKDYCDIAATYRVKSWKLTYKEPVNMAAQFKSAYDYCRKYCLPVLLDIQCYRWTEHVGIGYDWDLGYRKEEEVYEWKKHDIIENPDIIGVDVEYVKEESKKYKKYFQNQFDKCKEMKDSYPENIYLNV
jgi:TPP-dependent pyruvate/acetoin dehydrogenase alpha subunit